MTSPELRVLIADDEPLVRRGLREFLALEPDASVVGEAGDGLETVRLVEELTPNLLLLDVQMPELDGFEVLAALPPAERPVVVFVTAHDTYALRAFEVAAVDYLLKPFDRERFARSLDRARHWLSMQRGESDAGLQRLLSAASERQPARFVVKHAGRLRVVSSADLEWAESRGNYVLLHTHEGEHLLRLTLAELQARLDAGEFARVHRSALVRVARVHELQRLPGGDYRLRLDSGATIKVSRTHWPALAKALGRDR